jgi:hypothetical protein
MIVCMSSFSSTLLPMLSSGSTSTNPLQELADYLFYTKNVKHCQFVPPLLMSLYGIGCVSGILFFEGNRIENKVFHCS